MENRKKYKISIIVILMVSLLLNLSYNNWGLPGGEWHPDEIVDKSCALFAKKTLNPHFFGYPSLQIYMIALLIILPGTVLHMCTNIIHGSPFLEGIYPDFHCHWQYYLCSRTLTALMGAMIVFIVYLIAKKIFDQKVGIISAACLTLTAGFVNLSHFATVDIPVCFWMTLSFFSFLLIMDRESSLRYAIAGMCVGLAASTKYTGILMFPSLIMTFAICLKNNQPRNICGYIFNRYLFILITAMSIGFVIGTPFAIINLKQFLVSFIRMSFYQDTYIGIDQRSYLPHIFNLFNIYGVFLGCVSLFGFFYAIFLSFRQRESRIFLLLFTIIVIYLKMGSMHFGPDRYIITVVPFLTICTGKLIRDVIKQYNVIPPFVTKTCMIVLASGLIYSGIYTLSGIMQMKNDDRNLARAWVLKNIPANEIIEMTPSYGINIFDEYKNVSSLPFFHKKEAFARMVANIKYKRVKKLLPFLVWDDDHERYKMGIEPDECSLDALLRRKPKYLIISKLSYERFFNQKANAETYFPLQHHLYQSLLEGDTPYKRMVEFKTNNNIITPKWEFINAGIIIFKYRS